MSLAPARPPNTADTPDPERARRRGQVALKAFLNITRDWGLKSAEQRVLLGQPPRSTFYNWQKRPPVNLPRDTLERISCIMGIYKALHILFPRAAQADAWPRRPNQEPPFNGASALDTMLAGNVADLALVRRYLDAQRG